MFGLDCRCQSGIVGAHLEFERFAAYCELPLERINPGALSGIEIELLVQQGMQFAVSGRFGRQHGPANPHASNGCGECD